MKTFLDYIETGKREEFMDSITNTCKKFGFTHGDESWAGNGIYVKVKTNGAVEFDITADFDTENETFENIGYVFADEIKAYHLESVFEYNSIDEEFTTNFGDKTNDRQDMLNNIGEYYEAIICKDEDSFVIYGEDIDEADEDTTFNDMEWFTIASRYGEL